jgi:Poxvirus A32 protein
MIDYDEYYEKPEHVANHAPFFPTNILCVIAGSSGSGKTNLMLNFLLREGMLDYSDVYIYASTLGQRKYEFLKQYYAELENAAKRIFKISTKIAHFFDVDDEIKNPNELDPNTNHVMVFDDVMLEDQTKIKEYYLKGRHNNVNVFYLCQSMYKIAKHCIRQNANVFILFYQDDKTLKYFHETHSGDMDFKEFKAFCDSAWAKKHGFVLINNLEEPHCGRYVTNCTDIYIPSKYLKLL